MLRMSVGLLSVSLGVAAVVAQPSGYAGEPIAGAAALGDIKLLKQAMESVHPGYERYAEKSALNAALSAMRREVRGGTTDAEMYRLVSAYTALVRCDHTKAELPASMKSWWEGASVHLPMRTVEFDGRLYVDESAAAGIERGDEVLSINGISTAELIERIGAYVPVDGFTDGVKGVSLCATSEWWAGSGLDQFWGLEFGWADEFEIEVRRGETVSIVTADAITREASVGLTGAGGSVDFGPETISVEYTETAGGAAAAVLTVDTFVNYRKNLDAMAIFDGVFREIEAAGVERLVVDLRENGGGSDDASLALFRHLIDEAYISTRGTIVKTMRVPEAVKQNVSTWDMSVLEPEASMFDRLDGGGYRMKGGPQTVPPADAAFGGEVVLLSSRGNSSGSTMFLATLREAAGARVIGEATGGSVEGPTAGVIVFLELPASGVRVRVPLIRTETGLAFEPGMGLTPDVVVPRTAADFFAGRDAALEVALGQ